MELDGAFPCEIWSFWAIFNRRISHRNSTWGYSVREKNVAHRQYKRGLVILVIAILAVLWRAFLAETPVGKSLESTAREVADAVHNSRIDDRDRGGDSRVERGDGTERAAQKETTQPSQWPIWTSTRTQSARENAEAHWNKHRREFPEYRSAQEYIEGAHQFLRGPPSGTLFKSRDNGDRLLYDPATNTFAVQSGNGAPRTMFRPRNGQQYWNRQ